MSDELRTVDQVVEDALRDELGRLLPTCSDSQRAMFSRLFDEPVPAKDLRTALDLVIRTVRKNRVDPERLSR